MTLTNFLIIGAAKSGTSSLYRYMDQHPQIYMSPEKETNFFALEGEKLDFRSPGAQERIHRWSVTSIEDYRALFEGVRREKAIGEASPLYLYSPKAVERIRHHVPEARLIAVLRNPAERAYSSFLHMVRNGREPFSDFGRALEAEEQRIRSNWEWSWHHKNLGFYHAQLSRYYATFRREQIRVYLYEDFNEDPLGVLRDVFGFLGVDTSFTPKMTLRYQATGIPRYKTLDAFLRTPNPFKSALKPFLPKKFRRYVNRYLQNHTLVKPPFPKEARRQLVEAYREDVLKLQGLIGRDLSSWLR